jgi:hypothetical protein
VRANVRCRPEAAVVDGLPRNTIATTATTGWAIYHWLGFEGSEGLDEAYVPFFGAFGALWDDAMVARWSANPLAMLWPEMDAQLVAHQLRRGRSVVIIAGS